MESDRVLTPVFLASGVALVVAIFARVSLALALLGSLLIVTSAFAFRLHRLDKDQRRSRLSLIARGAGAGILATAAYDLSKGLLALFVLQSTTPFEAIPIFGELIVGEGTFATHLSVGILFHVLNGTAFGIAYVTFVRRLGPVTGIGWGLILETAQLLVYPQWLNIANLAEFAQVTAFAHLVYGYTLGITARSLVARAVLSAPRVRSDS